MRRSIGIIATHPKAIELTIEALENRGSITKTLPAKEKEAIAMKHIADKFIIKDIGIPEEEWKKMEMIKIHHGSRKDQNGQML